MFFSKNLKLPIYRSILFVCTANITRSPSMEALFRNLVIRGTEEWQISSAGVMAHKGSPPHPVISFILSQRGISIAKHRSKPIDKKLISQYYWIIVAEQQHKESLISQFPEVANRIAVLREYTTDLAIKDTDLPDPTGKEVGDYAELFFILDKEIPILNSILESKISDLR